MAVSDETREKWDEYIEFVIFNQDPLNDTELEILEKCQDTRDKGLDLSIKQSFWLNKMVKRLEK